jgi:hypothetical protein
MQFDVISSPEKRYDMQWCCSNGTDWERGNERGGRGGEKGGCEKEVRREIEVKEGGRKVTSEWSRKERLEDVKEDVG